MLANRQFIVTTTVNKPTNALLQYANNVDWTLIVVGDLKTPHLEYENLNCVYLHPDFQAKEYFDLSASIGWNTIQRRNIGFVEAWRRGAEIIATVDDDNIPYDNWGRDLLINKFCEVDLFTSEQNVFDPLSVTNNLHLWHRGFPIELVPDRLTSVRYGGKILKECLVQADLWDGDPDIDAIGRLAMRPCVKFSDISPFCSNKISPFNSQNTFISRRVLPKYAVFPFVGRMDDIWGGYILQKFFPECVVYNNSSVFQDRNPQDLVTNLENEVVGYRNTLKLIDNLDNWSSNIPEKSLRFWEFYTSSFI